MQGYKDVAGRATQDAKAEEQALGLLQNINLPLYIAASLLPRQNKPVFQPQSFPWWYL